MRFGHVIAAVFFAISLILTFIGVRTHGAMSTAIIVSALGLSGIGWIFNITDVDRQ